MLTIAFVTGTEPGKWFRRYEELTGSRLETVPSDDPLVLVGKQATAALVRLPDERVTDEHHVVRLYEEAAGVAVPKDSLYAEVGEVTREDLADEIVNFDGQSPIDDLRSALQVVAANVGVAYAPLPLLKNLARKQIKALELAGEEPATQIALVWRKVDDSDAVQDFVGVTKGRTVRSSRSSRGKSHPRSGAKRAQR
ncbi:LysR family transcriptional regulator substrate-binding protein [Corynebacterium pilbarense]|uniref:LysR family transcriptional regulator substrate-binding protein n=1 Tax=Corynebacterium pilbarense TaxID=1288393 RepID=A0A9Q4IH90_9CORY|nr:LysR family transcriptional regulator substrate-binding protein [Corynebacterium pilbarense]MCG7295511.1 LysR family transcriptional regulator substrate-binding protein [Corynebacterium afermentans]MCZ2221072.1 LysR family transcriptional regulator substrate-binding protein [Corynebacterium pilbarense]